MSVVLAVAAAVATYRLLVPGRWPWRVGDLAPLGTRDGHRSGSDPRAEGPPGNRRAGAVTSGPVSSRRRATPGPLSVGGLRARRERVGDSSASLALAADLLVVAALAGHPPGPAVAAVAPAMGGPVGDALAEAHRRHRRGLDLAASLDGVVDRLGPGARPLVGALQSSLAAGTPLAPALQRVADGERLRHRRRVEARVRRLPVLLLVPLVGLVLPAFVVVTLVPVGVATARAGGGLAAPSVAASAPAAFPEPA